MASGNGARWGLAIACAGVLVASCGGGGGSSNDGSTAGNTGKAVDSCPPSGAAEAANVLFGADMNSGTLTAFNTRMPSCQTWEAHIFATVDGGANGLAYDAGRDELYVLVDRAGAQQVQVFAHASTLGAGATPARSIALSTFLEARAIALDTVHDRLWVGGERTSWAADGGEVDVYENASTRSGANLAERQIQGLPGIINMAFDATRSILYTVGGVSQAVLVYTNTDALASGAAPAFVMSGSAGSFGIAIDSARDIVYLPQPGTGLKVVHGASSGAAATAVNIPLVGARMLTASVDSTNDRLYLGAYTDAYVFDHASTLTPSTVVPHPAATAASTVVVSAFATP